MARLYDAGYGVFGIGEELTLARNTRKVQVVRYPTIDDTACYVDAVRAGKIVMPVEIFSYDSHSRQGAALTLVKLD